MIRFCAMSAIVALSAAFILFGQTSSGQAGSATAQTVPQPVCAQLPLTETGAFWVKMSKLSDIIKVSTAVVDKQYELGLTLSGEPVFNMRIAANLAPEICLYPANTRSVGDDRPCVGTYESVQLYVRESISENTIIWALLTFSRSPTVRSECFAEGAPQYGDPTAVTQRLFRSDAAQLYLEITEPK